VEEDKIEMLVKFRITVSNKYRVERLVQELFAVGVISLEDYDFALNAVECLKLV
jgi:hypothetical protein